MQQVQQQQAQRNADQAAQTARSLQSQARAAQSVASRAQENARSISVEAEQAGSRSAQAQQGLASFKSLTQLQSGFDDLRQQISSVLSTDSAATTPVQPAAVINTSGQETGTLINVTA
jgi:hypothetical protein